jgi:succinate dehydrogenase / fumarate reductase iron-sulfur subunit
MHLIVRRYHEGMPSARYDAFELEPEPGMTVLGALFYIQEHHDDSLAFRYSCRGAVCGTCAMLINRVPRLACRTQMAPLLKGEPGIHLAPFLEPAESPPWDWREGVLVEPLPHLPVIRDLIVDMSTFFESYRFIDPVFRPAGPAPGKERPMRPGAVKALETYTTCILCAACFGACPVDGKNPGFLGPAALAKLYRFYIDPREGERVERLERADFPDGWWACEFHGNCRTVCPKGVPPILAIGQARQELKRKKEKPGDE